MLCVVWFFPAAEGMVPLGRMESVLLQLSFPELQM